jgi:hypothetical protein
MHSHRPTYSRPRAPAARIYTILNAGETRQIRPDPGGNRGGTLYCGDKRFRELYFDDIRFRVPRG